MATDSTTTNLDPVLKNIYKERMFNMLTFKKRPLLGMLAKFEKFGGRSLPVPIVYGNPAGGRSRVFSTAQANRSAVVAESFDMTRVSDYLVAGIDGEAIEATRDDSYAFIAGLKAVVDGAINAMSDSIETALFRTASGAIASVGALSTVYLTLAQINDIYNFELNMELVFADDAIGTTLRAGTATVTGVNYQTGVLTSDANWVTAQITGLIVGDYIFVHGDQAGGGSSVLNLSGLQSWFPAAAPSSTAFFGVNRSVSGRLYGTIHDGSADPVEEALIDAESKTSAMGMGSPTVVVMHHAQVRALNKELGAKKEYSEVAAQNGKGMIANISYRGITVQGDNEVLKIVAANKCPTTTAFGLNLESCKFMTLGRAVKFLSEDGLRILRYAASDGYELRVGSRGNFCCNAPASNFNLTLATP